MYLSHFGLNQSPFGITPNPAFFYSGSKRGDILEALLYAVTHGEGIVKVTGEVGSGKTMLCRMLESMMPANIEVIYLVNPTLSRAEVVFAIAGELEIVTTGKRTDEVIRMLHHDLITKHVMGKQVVLLVEEAQAMPLETLEEIRLFSNLETAHHKLLQIVLFGQPELDESLALPHMRQLKERITHSFSVPPMTADVIPQFLMFRMRAAGYHGPDLFSKAAVKMLADVSKGIVRRINILADKALLAAFAENAHAVEARHVKAAIGDSAFTTVAAARPRNKLVIALIVAVAVIVAADIGWRIFSSQSFRAGTQQLATLPAVRASASASAVETQPLVAQSAADLPAAATPVVPPAASASSAQITAVPTDSTASAASASSAVAASTKLVAASSQATAAAPVVGPLQQRIAASQIWLRTAASDQYTIQLTLIDAASAAYLERFLTTAGSEVGIDQLYLYPTRIGGVPSFGIVYSSFDSREDAKVKLTELARKWSYSMQLRTVGGLRAEIQRTRSDDVWPK